MKQFIKKAQSLAFAASLLFSVGMSALPYVHAAAATSLTAAPRVTFTFDDGLSSALSLAAPTLQKYGLTGTNYIITKCVATTGTCLADPAASYMTWDQIKQLHDVYGWNIGSHTQTHPYLASTGGGEQALLTDAQIETELRDSKADLAAQGYDAVDFAAPYGDYNNTVLATGAKYYATFRGFADLGNNIWPYNDRLIVNEQIQEGTTGGAPRQTLATVKAYIDSAITNGQWLTLTFHNITSTTPKSSDDYTTSNTLLDQIAAYVKQQADAGKISVVTPHDAIVNGTNMLANGSFDSAISTDYANRNTTGATQWVTDDTTGILVKQDTGTNGSYVLGNASSPTNSLYISANGADAHIWAPKVTIDPTKTYIIKGYFNIKTITAGEVAYYVDEYDANGAVINTQYSSAVRYDANVNAIRVKNANFAYKPTVGAVAARIYINVQGNSGITGYMDNLEMIDPSGTTTTTPKAGDINGDGSVNLNDLSILSSNWNKTGMTAAQGDLNGDGSINLNDLSILSSNWNK